MVFSNNLLMGAGGQASGYEIDQSIRFNDDDAAYLYRDNDAAQTDTKKFTYSVWIKRGAITGGTNTGLLSGGSGTTSGRSDFIFTAGSATGDSSNNDSLKFDIYTGGWTQIRTTAKLRDPSSWYHIVLVYDAANGTANDTLIMYLNNTRLTLDSTSGVPNNLSLVNANGQRTRVGADASGTPVEYDGYMAEINMIDGQALTPASFGETNTSGVWVPKAYSGSYGNNGFFIDGRDSSDLGDDESGNGNDFTSTGLVAADQMLDSPTNNFSIFSPIASCNVSGQALTISDGNLRTSAGGTTNAIEAVTQIAPTAGKYYAEFTLNAAPQLSNQYPAIGIIGIDLNITGGNNLNNSSFFGYLPNGNKAKGGTVSSYGDTYTNGDIIGIAMDLDNQKIWFSKNGTYQDSGDPAAGSDAAFTDLVAGTQYRFCVSHAGSTATDVTGNFGASAFNTAAPTGFKALSSANLPTPTIADPSKHFQTTLYNGTGSELEVDQSGENSTFQPDFAWIKNRSNAGNEHELYDAVRGATKAIFSSATSAESTQAQGLKSFDGDGFTVGTRGEVNTSGSTNVAWQWLANNTTGSTNDDGSVDSTVAVSTTAGFSIVKWVHTTSANYTVGHGLGVTPKMILVKTLDQGTNWGVYHSDITVGNRLILNTTAAQGTGYWGANTWNSTVFSIGSIRDANSSNAIAYVFAEIPGYSSIGSYEGNGNADGSFVYTGFRPSWLLIKNIDATESWNLRDSSRDPFNVSKEILAPNTNAAEATSGGGQYADLLSNGFKLRGTDPGVNSSATFIYMAFAEHPFGGEDIAPATAR